VHCVIKNTFANNVTVTPRFTTYYRTVFGKQVSSSTLSKITVPAGQPAPETFEIAKATDAQAYDAVLSLVDLQGLPLANTVIAHYVLHGDSATIQNMVFDKDFYQTGDTAKLTVFWTGPADDFPGSRITPTDPSTLTAHIAITNGSGGACANPYVGNLVTDANPGPVSVFSVSIMNTCTNPHADVALQNASGTVLAEHTFAVVSSAAATTVGGTSSTSTTGATSPASEMPLWENLAIAFIIVLGVGLTVKRVLRKKTTPAAPFATTVAAPAPTPVATPATTTSPTTTPTTPAAPDNNSGGKVMMLLLLVTAGIIAAHGAKADTMVIIIKTPLPNHVFQFDFSINLD